MRIEYAPAAAAALIDYMQRQMDSNERAPGTHVYDLVTCLRKGFARRKGLAPRTDVQSTLMFLVGRALHGRMELVEGETLVHVDGVHGSIDRVEQDEPWEQLVPCEIKTTYASAARPIEGSTHYLDQLGAYCYMLGVTRGRLYVLYLNGIYNYMRKKSLEADLAEKLVTFGYAPEDRPMLMAYDVEFSQAELEEHWRELQRRRALLEDGVERGVLPPIEEHHTWECEFCIAQGTAASIGCAGGPGNWLGNFTVEVSSGRAD